MLTRARVGKLCYGCRQDLQTLLERGFCGPAVVLRSSTVAPRLNLRRRQQSLRSFSYTSSVRQSPASRNYDEPRPGADNAALTEMDAVQEQLAALEELEALLSQPMEGTVEEDGHTTSDMQQGLALEQDGDVAISEALVEGADSPVTTMRNRGASHEQVVREARQIFGDSLPDDLLTGPELKVYKRLYGEPAEELWDKNGQPVEVEDGPRNELLDQYGEPVEYDSSLQQPLHPGEPFKTMEITHTGRQETTAPKPEGGIGFPSGRSVTTRPAESLESRARDIAESLGAELVEAGTDAEEADQDRDLDGSEDRAHPLTTLGKFSASPRTVFLPQEAFVRPVERVMSNFSNKHLKETCERTFGGPGLPDSPLTPRSGRVRPQVPIPLDASQHSMGEMEANAFITTIMPPTYAAITAVLVETRKRLGSTWLNNLLTKEGGPRVLDVGAGGAGIIAWRQIVNAHWDAMHSSDRHPPAPPATKAVVLTGSETLRHRSATLLENTTFIPRLPDYVHVRDAPTLEDDRPAQQRKQFDVIIAPHTLFGLKEDWVRKQQVQNLWSMLSPEGGVLILIEKGIPRGFEAIAGARHLLLERYIATPEGQSTYYSSNVDEDLIHEKGTGMIIAPCTNHEKCPMYKTPGISTGRKDFCSFQQRYIRPSYLQRVLGAKDRNHDDVDFSYISVMKGEDLRQRQLSTWQGLEDGLSAARHPEDQVHEDYETWMDLCQQGFSEVSPGKTAADSISPYPDGETRASLPAPWNLPRTVFQPMKRRGHVLLDLCTPAGQIERWTVPRSFSKQAYRDARKSEWGDLWALGAKTRVPRNLKLGGPGSKEGMRAKGREDRLKNQAAELLENMEEEKLADLEEQRQLEMELSGDEKPRKDKDDHFDDHLNDVLLREWEEEFEIDQRSHNAKGKKDGAFAKFGSATKEARREQKRKVPKARARQ